MKLKKLLALTLAGVMTAATLTACAPLEDLYDWFFGGGSSSASRGNGTGLDESEALERSIIDYFGLTNTTREKDEAEPVLQEVAKRFDPESWYTNGQLNGIAQAALDAIAKDKLTLNGSSKYTCVDVWEVQSSQTDFPPSADRQLYEDLYSRSGGEATTDAPTHYSFMTSYNDVKSWIQSTSTSNVYAGVFQKNGKTYAAMVIIW